MKTLSRIYWGLGAVVTATVKVTRGALLLKPRQVQITQFPATVQWGIFILAVKREETPAA